MFGFGFYDSFHGIPGFVGCWSINRLISIQYRMFVFTKDFQPFFISKEPAHQRRQSVMFLTAIFPNQSTTLTFVSHQNIEDRTSVDPRWRWASKASHNKSPNLLTSHQLKFRQQTTANTCDMNYNNIDVVGTGAAGANTPILIDVSARTTFFSSSLWRKEANRNLFNHSHT